jgi:hypothetical protein
LGTTHTIGDFAKLDAKDIKPHIRLNLPVRDFTLDWRRCNLVANYVAEYVSYYFDQRDRAENLVSSVLYELMEHLVSSARDETAVDVGFSTAGEWLVFEISFFMPPEEQSRLKELLGEINTRDIDSYYMEVLENGPEKAGPKNAMGIVMIAHDYRAHLSALLHEDGEPSVVRAYIGQEEIAT